jgi:RimJ/RimL family protein N-acetyltransferase
MQEIKKVMIPRLKKYLDPSKGWGIWQVNTLESRQYIGWVLVRPNDFFSAKVQFDNLELGWRFKSHVWGQGFATESATHIMRGLSFNDTIQKFCAIAVPENTDSIRVMEKLGMHYVKTYIHQDPLGNSRAVYYERNRIDV